MKPFTHASAPGTNFGVPTGGSSKRLFCFRRDPQSGLSLESLLRRLNHDQGRFHSGMMIGQPQARRRLQRGIDPCAWGCVVQPSRAQLARILQCVLLMTDVRRPKPVNAGLGLFWPENL